MSALTAELLGAVVLTVSVPVVAVPALMDRAEQVGFAKVLSPVGAAVTEQVKAMVPA